MGTREMSPASPPKAGVHVNTAEKSGSQGVWPLEREARASAHVDGSLGKAVVSSQPPLCEIPAK